MNEYEIINFIVEIPKGSKNKYEYDWKTKTISLNRVLYGANFYPGEYGFIENTLDLDGDPLDVLVMSTYPTFPGCKVKAKILGTINMIDDNEIDTKLFGVVATDPRFQHINKLKDVPDHIKKEFENFLLQYKVLQNKKVIINGWNGIDAVKKEIKECKARFLKYRDAIKKEGIENIKKIWKKNHQ